MPPKRNIAYIKPADPSFLAKLKAEIGYREGPTIDTKRQVEDEGTPDWGSDSGSDRERDDEKPLIVVLRKGDLSADQVAQEEKRIAEEAEKEPADLSKRVIFRKRKTADEVSTAEETASAASTAAPGKKSKILSKPTPKSKETKSNQKITKSVLSFNAEEDEAEGETSD